MSEKKTHEEWFVGVRQRCQVRRGEKRWYNAYGWYDDGHKLGDRYVDSEEKARKVLDNAYRLWNGKKMYDGNGKRYDVHQAGMIGIATEHTKEADYDMEIVEHVIRKRTVTEWEEVEKE